MNDLQRMQQIADAIAAEEESAMIIILRKEIERLHRQYNVLTAICCILLAGMFITTYLAFHR